MTTSSGLVLLWSFWCHSSIIPPLHSLLLFNDQSSMTGQILLKSQPMSIWIWIIKGFTMFHTSMIKKKSPESQESHLLFVAQHLLHHHDQQLIKLTVKSPYIGGIFHIHLEANLWAYLELYWFHCKNDWEDLTSKELKSIVCPSQQCWEMQWKCSMQKFEYVSFGSQSWQEVIYNLQ